MRLLLSAFTLMAIMIAEAQADNRATRLLDALVASYPDHLSGHDGRYLLWKDGTRMVFDDGKGPKPFKQLLNNPDLEDQFYTPYLKGRAGTAPGVNIDPGRVRFEPFFTKMYGDCKKGAVKANMVTITWLPKTVAKRIRVTRVNGVAKRLQAVSNDLEALPKRYRKFLNPIAGIYNCRKIAGTRRYSVHAYGAAIDINVKHAHYWRWSKPNKKGRYPYRNNIPIEIVEIFERHGFIWGGKWYHYDTMHFEYRPELLAVAPQ